LIRVVKVKRRKHKTWTSSEALLHKESSELFV